ncbi:MAG: hypothetical protein ACTSVE_09240, partial [Candidatus Helarchaeota archaeon]
MTKWKKKNSNKRFTPLSKHTRKGKKLMNPFNQLKVPIKHFNWERDFLPEFLWIDALANYYKNDQKWYEFFDEFIDIIEAYLDNDNFLMGTISDFGKVPENVRSLILKENKDYIVKAFITPIGNLLRLYPSSPAHWLAPSEWLDEKNKEEELQKLKNAILRLIKGKDDYCRNIRFMPFRRLCKHGKVLFPPSMDKHKLFSNLNQYPERCEIEEKFKLGAMIHPIVNETIRRDNPDFNWSKMFWNNNYELSKCIHHNFQLIKSREVSNDYVINLMNDIKFNCDSL